MLSADFCTVCQFVNGPIFLRLLRIRFEQLGMTEEMIRVDSEAESLIALPVHGSDLRLSLGEVEGECTSNPAS